MDNIVSELIIKKILIKTIRETDEMYWYDQKEGYWKTGADQIIEDILSRLKPGDDVEKHIDKILNSMGIEKVKWKLRLDSDQL